MLKLCQTRANLLKINKQVQSQVDRTEPTEPLNSEVSRQQNTKYSMENWWKLTEVYFLDFFF